MACDDGYLTILQAADVSSAAEAAEDEEGLQELALRYLEEDEEEEENEEEEEEEEEEDQVRLGSYVPQPEASPNAPAPRKCKLLPNGKRDMTSMNCIECRKVRASWGLPVDRKKIWCAGCGRKHLREGAQVIKTVGDGYCEDCMDSVATFGMPIDWKRENSVTDRRGNPVGARASGKEKRCRWCRSCAANHPGAVRNQPSARPEAIAAKKIELQKRREARAVAKKERRKKSREEVKAGRMKAPVSSCVRSPLDSLQRSIAVVGKRYSCGMDVQAEKAPYVSFHAVEQLRFKYSVALYALEAPLREWENAPAPILPPTASSKHGAYDLWAAQQRPKLRAEMLNESGKSRPPPIHPPTMPPAVTSCVEDVSTTTTPAHSSLPTAAASASASTGNAQAVRDEQKLTPQQVAQLADRVSKQWRALPQAERDEWEARVEQQGNDYIAAVRAYVAVPPPVVFGCRSARREVRMSNLRPGVWEAIQAADEESERHAEQQETQENVAQHSMSSSRSKKPPNRGSGAPSGKATLSGRNTKQKERQTKQASGSGLTFKMRVPHGSVPGGEVQYLSNGETRVYRLPESAKPGDIIEVQQSETYPQAQAVDEEEVSSPSSSKPKRRRTLLQPQEAPGTDGAPQRLQKPKKDNVVRRNVLPRPKEPVDSDRGKTQKAVLSGRITRQKRRPVQAADEQGERPSSRQATQKTATKRYAPSRAKKPAAKVVLTGRIIKRKRRPVQAAATTAKEGNSKTA